MTLHTRKNPFEPPAGGLSLYIHVPFCERKCNYCAFESAVPREGDVSLWLASLEKEIALWTVRLGRVSLNTCYIGGGTPSVLSGPVWMQLIGILERCFDFGSCAEVTVEANPNSLSAEHLLAWREWRVTRVSLGVQSFDDAELEMMGRLHSARQAYNAISASLASGLGVSLDLMFGLPAQTLQNWARTLKEAAAFRTGHISLYQLSLEPGTPWSNLDASLLSDGYAQYRFAQWYLEKKGYRQYEVANFAKPGQESRHNLNYWNEGEYLGIGPGASGYLKGWRYKNSGVLPDYAARVESGRFAVISGETLSPEDRAKEAAVLALRTVCGIDVGAYRSLYGDDALSRLETILSSMPQDFFELSDERIALSKKGMRLANLIWSEIV